MVVVVVVFWRWMWLGVWWVCGGGGCGVAWVVGWSASGGEVNEGVMACTTRHGTALKGTPRHSVRHATPPTSALASCYHAAMLPCYLVGLLLIEAPEAVVLPLLLLGDKHAPELHQHVGRSVFAPEARRVAVRHLLALRGETGSTILDRSAEFTMALRQNPTGDSIRPTPALLTRSFTKSVRRRLT